jgi:hypothetical protein
MDTILGILSGENYSDTRVLVDIVSVYLHRCQQCAREEALHGVCRGAAVILAIAQIRLGFDLRLAEPGFPE